MVNKREKISWTIDEQVLQSLEDELVSLNQNEFEKNPKSMSRLAEAHIKRSMKNPGVLQFD